MEAGPCLLLPPLSPSSLHTTNGRGRALLAPIVDWPITAPDHVAVTKNDSYVKRLHTRTTGRTHNNNLELDNKAIDDI